VEFKIQFKTRIYNNIYQSGPQVEIVKARENRRFVIESVCNLHDKYLTHAFRYWYSQKPSLSCKKD